MIQWDHYPTHRTDFRFLEEDRNLRAQEVNLTQMHRMDGFKESSLQ